MKTTITNYGNDSFEMNLRFSHEQRGYGQWHIVCDAEYSGKTRSFREYTTDSEFIDRIADMRSSDDATYEEIQNAYFERYFSDLKEIILEWVESVNVDNITDEEYYAQK